MIFLVKKSIVILKIGPCHCQMSFLAKIDVNTAVVPSYSGYSFGPKSTRKF